MTHGLAASGLRPDVRCRIAASGTGRRRLLGRRAPVLPAPWRLALLVALLAGALALPGMALATPGEIGGIGLNQRLARQPGCDLLRVWVIYVGQGDAILIQIPPRFATNGAPTDEVVDVLVDGGPSGKQLQVFLKALYPQSTGNQTPTTIEHVVLTHHDSDHVTGLTGLLKSRHFDVRNIYHNGLASWRLGQRGFPLNDWPPRNGAIYDSRKTKGMGLLESDGITLRSEAVVDSLQDLKDLDEDSFQGTYARFAKAALAQSPPVESFRRSHRDSGAAFVPGLQGDDDCGPLRLDALWPPPRPRKFGGWGYTINGNSVTFKLTYGRFSMLFAGDHNEVSERVMLETLQDEGTLGSLRSDVLKTPHHGSKHNLERFFDTVDPVVSVASMGKRGFSLNWKHPSTEVVDWSGGPKRSYHTYIHERPFTWSAMTSASARETMVERKHVLVETDGVCFRVVEIPDIDGPDWAPPSVQQTDDGDGTRWICKGA